jgi:hypothetical protein
VEAEKIKVSRHYLERILERLYSFYPHFVEMKVLSWNVMGKEPDEEMRTACVYLKDKGLITQSPKGRWRIMAAGIDLLERRLYPKRGPG